MIALFLGIMVYAQETVEISMGSGYADRVFFNLNDMIYKTKTSLVVTGT
jgi:hypothetical protein